MKTDNEYKYDFAKISNKIPMIDFIESLNSKEQAKQIKEYYKGKK